ncbi:MAG: phage/plasmid primase, P4 family [Bacteroidales bacterium]|nr:phage/plasmid primase, P4 family [Bacteroidales bacterium]
MRFDAIPHSMRDAKRWVVWKGDKEPYKHSSGRASSTDKRTWGTFDEVVAAYKSGHFKGIGFVLGDGWMGLDADDVRDPDTGEWMPGVLDEIKSVESYAEISPSGSGAHVITYGTKPGDRCRAAGGAWEMYDHARYFTVTGNHIPGTPDEVHEAAPGSLETVYAKIGTPEEPHADPGRADTSTPVDLTDDEVIALCERAANAPKFNALWRGDISGYPSQSEADIALCNILAFYTQDAGQIDRLVRQSGLYREKWNRRKGYRDSTISAAIAGVRETYTPGGLRTGTAREGDSFNRTDAGNSERLVRLYGDDIRHCEMLKSWYVWDGKRWEPDTTNRMLEFATQTARNIFHEAGEAQSSEERKALARWAARSESLAVRRAMIAGAVIHVPVRPDDLDKHPNLFNCLNGTLDLITGGFREHRHGDLLTKMGGIEYDPDAKCPLWSRHIHTVFGGDGDLARGFQELCGYSLLQENPENVMAILHGNGHNGKSQTIRAISSVFGDYAATIKAETLMQTKYADGGRARPDVIKLKGARFITCSEADQDSSLSESLVKTITGDDVVSARKLYCEEIEFVPGGVVFMGTNHLPKITGTDDGIWRRILPYPFTAVIPKEEKIPNYGAVLFERESSGIFNWMLTGVKRYQENRGLTHPTAVEKARQEYRIHSNPVGAFVEEWCVVGVREQVGKTDLHTSYTEWCDSAGVRALSATAFGKIMGTLFDEGRNMGNRFWLGLRLKTLIEIENGVKPVTKQMGLDGGDSRTSTPEVGHATE